MIDNDEREAIRVGATDNASKDWQTKQNPFDSRDVRYPIYESDYQAAGGKN